MDGSTDLSRLPQVDALLRDPAAEVPIHVHGRRAVAAAVRRTLEAARVRARDGVPVARPDELLADAVGELDARKAQRLHRVINATGVVLHTNLGRAPLGGAAREALVEAAGYVTLEFEVEAGRRGSRTDTVGQLAAEACGTEAATVVNNGAAALVLVLAALAAGRDAIVSRGELIEIGGSFRLPDVMAASGAVLREVGTTNRTRADDYRAAVSDRTGLILKVHPSNYRVVGFAETPAAAELSAIAREAGVPFIHDLGSGLLRDLPPEWGGPFAGEPSVDGAIRAGADLVVFSGDKLLGGPQAGIIAGRSDLVLRCERHPLARALRIDKLRRAALEATFDAHLHRDVPVDLPVWSMLAADPDALAQRARAIAGQLGGKVTAEPAASLVGGGSLPGVELDSWAVVIPSRDPQELARHLRSGDPIVVARVEADRVLLDLRTVPPASDGLVTDAVRAALGLPPNA